ncbi:MAG: hypothetical protein CUN57_00850, partial [Phototrophicales bacterium]
IEASLRLLAAIEPDTLRMVEYMAVEPGMRFVQRFLELLKANEVITEADLMHETWKYLKRPSEFDEAIQMLLRTRTIKFTTVEGKPAYQLIRKDV